MNEIESVVLCEGYHDRAFWTGWLQHLGCANPGQRQGSAEIRVKDPWGDRVRGGEFAFHSATRLSFQSLPRNASHPYSAYQPAM